MSRMWLQQAYVWTLLAGMASLMAVTAAQGQTANSTDRPSSAAAQRWEDPWRWWQSTRWSRSPRDTAEEVVLYRDGRPKATIVTAAKAPATVELAALELQHHLEQMTGHEFPRQTDAEPVEGTVILVGESKLTRELGLRNEDFERQEYLVQTRPGALILMGHDRQVFGEVRYDDPLTPEEMIESPWPAARRAFQLYPGWTKWDAIGTCYAVYDFLERHCGVRWYLPGPLGTHVPPSETLVVREVNLRRKPWMRYREGYQYEGATPRRLYAWDRTQMSSEAGRPWIKFLTHKDIYPYRETQLWVLRNKGWGEPFAANHSYHTWEAAFKEEHPDWFAQGRVNLGAGLELCFSHPEVKERMIQDARDYFDGKQPVSVFAAGDYFSIVPTDGKGWCLCDQCQAQMDPPYDLDVQSMGGKALIAGSASRYVWNFIAEVADAVAKSHPDKFISALAYTDYLVPPEDMERRENLAVMFCLQPTQTAFAPHFEQFNREHLQEWSRVAGGGVYAWVYTCYPQYFAGARFPDLSYHKWAEWIRLFHQLGIRGFYDNMDGQIYVAEGDISVSRAAVAPYIPVWPNPMEDFFRVYAMLKLADDISLDENELYDEFYRLWYGAAAEAIKGFVLKSQEMYDDPNYKVDGVVRPQGYSPWRDILGVYHGEGVPWEDVVWGSVCTAEDLEKLGAYIAEAYRVAATPEAQARVRLFDEGVYQGIVTGRSQWVPAEVDPEYEEEVLRTDPVG